LSRAAVESGPSGQDRTRAGLPVKKIFWALYLIASALEVFNGATNASGSTWWGTPLHFALAVVFFGLFVRSTLRDRNP
jgi:hypothetical protein